MDLLAAYSSDEESSQKQVTSSVQSAPDVALTSNPKEYHLTLQNTKEITHNVPYSYLYAAPLGPQNPNHAGMSLAPANRNIITGHFEEVAVSDVDFHEQRKNFQFKGWANNPDAAGAPHAAVVQRASFDQEKVAKNAAERKKRLPKGDPSVLDSSDPNAYLGPWAPHPSEVGVEETSGLTEAEREMLEKTKAMAKTAKAITPGSESSTLHIDSVHDYLGRSYLHPPAGMEVPDDEAPGELDIECYIPKREIHTFRGHSKGVNCVRFFPRSGHLFISASMDGKVKLWRTTPPYEPIRTFHGHNKGVRDVQFSKSGRNFLTASYDKYMKLWDTETGQCISSWTTGKIPYVGRFYPEDEKIILGGMHDKKIVQFDTNMAPPQTIQEYDAHLGPINTITFIDNNRRFVSTSDDKTIRVWEFGIPVVIKYVAEPWMHSVVSTCVTPNQKYLLAQSLDNTIFTYSATDRFRQAKKRFQGHLCAGYACQVGTSPDGRFVMSGDGEGRMWFWDWKRGSVLKKFKAHSNVVMGCEWHPRETSKVLTCSWDGLIKYWD